MIKHSGEFYLACQEGYKNMNATKSMCNANANQ